MPTFIDAIRGILPDLIGLFRTFSNVLKAVIGFVDIFGSKITLAISALIPALTFATSSAIAGVPSFSSLKGGSLARSGTGYSPDFVGPLPFAEKTIRGAAFGTFLSAIGRATVAFAAITAAMYLLQKAMNLFMDWMEKRRIEGVAAITKEFNQNKASTLTSTVLANAGLLAEKTPKLNLYPKSSRGRYVNTLEYAQKLTDKLSEAKQSGNRDEYSRTYRDLESFVDILSKKLGDRFSVSAPENQKLAFSDSVSKLLDSSSGKSVMFGSASLNSVSRAGTTVSTSFASVLEALDKNQPVNAGNLEAANKAVSEFQKATSDITSSIKAYEVLSSEVSKGQSDLVSRISSIASDQGVSQVSEVKGFIEMLKSGGFDQYLLAVEVAQANEAFTRKAITEFDTALNQLKGAENLFGQITKVSKDSATYNSLRSTIIKTIESATGKEVDGIQKAVDDVLAKMSTDKRGKVINTSKVEEAANKLFVDLVQDKTDKVSQAILSGSETAAKYVEAAIQYVDQKFPGLINQIDSFLSKAGQAIKDIASKFGVDIESFPSLRGIPSLIRSNGSVGASTVIDSGTSAKNNFQKTSDKAGAKGTSRGTQYRFQDNSSQFLLAILGEDFETKVSDKLKPSLQSALTSSLQSLGDVDAPEQLASKIVSEDFSTRLEGHLEALRAFQEAALKARDSTRMFSDEWMNANNVVNQTQGAIQRIKLQQEQNSLLAQSAREVGEAFKGSLSNGISDFILGTKSAGEAFRAFIADFIQQAVRAMVNRAVQSLFGTAASSKAGGSGLFGALFSMIETGFSGGGSVKKLASGGFIQEGSGSKDDVPAMLMRGEYVLNRRAVSRLGIGFLDQVNSQSGSIQHFAEGGAVRSAPMSPPSVVSNSGNSTAISINVSSSGDSSTTKKGSGDSKGDDELARMLRNAVIEVLQDQKRIGGVLRDR